MRTPSDFTSPPDTPARLRHSLRHGWVRWLLSLAAAVAGAWLNHTLSVTGNGRLTFMLLYPAVLLAGYLGGLAPALAAACIGAGAVTLWHPEMTDGRTPGELASVGLFLLIAALIGGMFQRLHDRRIAQTDPLIPPPPERMTWGGWAVTGLALAAGLALSFSLNTPLHNRVPFIFLYPVIALAGYLGGWRPALVAGFIGAGITYFAHPALPRHSLETATVCGLFLLVVAVMGWLAECLHHEANSARAGAAALRELPEAQARLAAIAQTSPDALWIWDMKVQRVIFASRRIERLAGLSPDEACAQTPAEWSARIHPEDRATLPAARQALESAAAGQTVEFEFRLRQRDESWRWLRARTGVFTHADEGGVAQIFGHTEDVTDRHETSRRLAAQTAELERIAAEREGTIREREALLAAERTARAEAERANRLKDDFLATVSHELRTPLTAMLGWTTMLGEEARDDETRHGLEVIDRNARAQRQLIDDLLDVSRIMTGKLRIDARPVLLGEIVRAALAAVRPAADARGVMLTAEIEHCDEPIPGDADRLQQVVWNLLSNAVKFTSGGGQVRIHAAGAGDEAKLVVADTGQGIAAEFLPHVFERFRQEQSATAGKAAGLGLGLTIVKHLVELHGGTIRAESAGLGQGSTFTVTLPLRPAAEAAATRGK